MDDIFESDAITDQGEIVKDVEEESIIKLLSEALEAYNEGDSTKLEVLSKKSILGEEPVENEQDVVEEEDVEEPVEEEDPTLNEEGGPTTDSAIHLARRLLQGKRANKLIDAFSDKVTILRRVNFKMTDCVVQDPQAHLDVAVIDMPVSCEEYQTICPPRITPIMHDVIEEYRNNGNCVECPPVSNYTLKENGTVDINNGQLFIPTVAKDIFEERLSKAENNKAVQEIVSSMAIPVDKAMEVAAKCDNLSFIDPRFYKPRLGATAWSFDVANKPGCLRECPEGSTIERCSEDVANYHLFGVPYHVS